MPTPAIVDTVTEYSQSYRALQPPTLTNKYAAFPSLHAGWNLLVGIVALPGDDAPCRASVRLRDAAAMAFAVVATANHFVLDVVAGAAVVLVGLAVASPGTHVQSSTRMNGRDAESAVRLDAPSSSRIGPATPFSALQTAEALGVRRSRRTSTSSEGVSRCAT